MAYYAMTPCDPSALCAVLIAHMDEATSDGRWYALIDAAFDHGGKSLDLADGLIVYHQGRLQNLASASPTLFELSGTDPDFLQHQLRRLMRHCRGRPMLSFICSPLPASTVREHWQNLLEIETEDGESYLLRFADTRVLPALAEQREIWNRLATEVTVWWIVGRDGALTALDMPDSREDSNVPLRLSNESLHALISAGEADAMTEYMHQYFPDLLAGRDGNANYHLLTQTTALCNAQGIDGATEKYALGVAALLTDGRLLAHPDFTDWLAEKTWQTQGMEEALAGFMEDKDIHERIY